MRVRTQRIRLERRLRRRSFDVVVFVERLSILPELLGVSGRQGSSHLTVVLLWVLDDGRSCLLLRAGKLISTKTERNDRVILYLRERGGGCWCGTLGRSQM